MTMGAGRRRDYNDFSLRMSSSLSLKVECMCVCVCVVENLSRVFLSEMASSIFVGNEGIYSMSEG